MKIIVSNGTQKAELSVKIIDNKPLVVMSEKLYDDTILVTDSKIKNGFTPGAKLTYTFKSPVDENDVINNLSTIPSYYTSGKMDLIYLVSKKLLLLIPNVEDTLFINPGVLPVQGISIGGPVVSDSCYANLTVNHRVDTSTVNLDNTVTNVATEVNVNNFVGSKAGSNSNPSVLTKYLDDLVGEIAFSSASPVVTITIPTAALFKDDRYPSSLLYEANYDRLDLKHMESASKPSKYIIVLG